MRKLHERAPQVMEDLMKRASREFALGDMDKETFDEFIQHVEGINSIADRMKKSYKNGKK